MATLRTPQGLTFTVTTSGEIRLSPQPKLVPNAFDYMGQLLGLPRLPAEKNADYRLRLYDVYIHRAGANYEGLINGITRELGFSQYSALLLSATGASTDPRAVISGPYLRLYSEWKHDESFTLELEINLYDRDGGAFYLGDLVSLINGTSTAFVATLASGVSADTRSCVLLQADTVQWEDLDVLRPFKRNVLFRQNIISASEKFSGVGASIFANRVATEALVVAAGDYWIDYTNGTLVSYSTVPGNTSVRYAYRQLPAIFYASPVQLFEFVSDDYLKQIFEQVSLADGTTTNGLPKHEAVDYINELLGVRGMLWGR